MTAQREDQEIINVAPLPWRVIEPAVRTALAEDLGLPVIPTDHHPRFALAVRKPSVIAGLDVAALAFALVDPAISLTRHVEDGAA